MKLDGGFVRNSRDSLSCFVSPFGFLGGPSLMLRDEAKQRSLLEYLSNQPAIYTKNITYIPQTFRESTEAYFTIERKMLIQESYKDVVTKADGKEGSMSWSNDFIYWI